MEIYEWNYMNKIEIGKEISPMKNPNETHADMFVSYGVLSMCLIDHLYEV